jgi:predicted ribosome quality control (RQC) complex YloA/Tae2 family protein
MTIESREEMGDLSERYLYIEIMGKQSNIIFTNSDNVILDSIKHISAAVSSIREVLPGKEYFVPSQEGKINPLETSKEDFISIISSKGMPISKAIMSSFVGFSGVSANELCERAKLDSDQSTKSLSEDDYDRLSSEFEKLIDDLNNNNYSPNIIYSARTDKPIEFSAFNLTAYRNERSVSFDSISEMLETFYHARDIYANMHQRSTDLRKIITTLLSRNQKKLSLLEKQLLDTKKKDIMRKRGELIRAYLYMIEDGLDKVTLNDYETGENITIPLDPQLSPMENANKYFDK